MQTLQIANGDLVLAGGKLATIKGPDKIQQDLAVALLTPYGSDPYHPGFGSTLNSMVGQPAGGVMGINITVEIQRVIANYMAVQQSIVNASTTQGQQSPYAQNELVGQVLNVNADETGDEIDVTVSLLTIAGEALEVSAAITPATNSVT